MPKSLKTVQTHPVTDDEFAALIKRVCPHIQSYSKIAVAVSGGGDSLALLYLLSRWSAQNNGPRIHALTVDHQLRAAAADEARYVAQLSSKWPRVQHEILIWRGRKPATAVAERARTARYKLLHDYCVTHDIPVLILAHHMDDQAETFLMRLAAGSGLDGLAGMLPSQEFHQIKLVRPLLDVSHERLLATLRSKRVKWIEDPTNANTDYLRPRLRAARDVLAAEGLTSSRVAVTAARIARGRSALEVYADALWTAQADVQGQGVTFKRAEWEMWPVDMQIRLLTRAMGVVNGKAPPARMEQIEHVHDLLSTAHGKTVRVTLAACMITRGAKTVKITREKP